MYRHFHFFALSLDLTYAINCRATCLFRVLSILEDWKDLFVFSITLRYSVSRVPNWRKTRNYTFHVFVEEKEETTDGWTTPVAMKKWIKKKNTLTYDSKIYEEAKN